MTERMEKRAAYRKARRRVREIIDFLFTLLLALIVAFLIRSYVIELFDIEGDSMLPTLSSGQRLFIAKLFYKPERGDIVVLKYPDDPEDKFYVKRIVALEGDTVAVSGGTLAVNGASVKENYISGGIPYDYPELTVPEGCCFVLGDNRGHSKDSHIIGPVPLELICGEAIFKK